MNVWFYAEPEDLNIAKMPAYAAYATIQQSFGLEQSSVKSTS